MPANRKNGNAEFKKKMYPPRISPQRLPF
jgi:hypothetical protein